MSPDTEPSPALRPGRRRPALRSAARSALGWVPAVVLVPTGVLAAVQVSEPRVEGAELRELHPLEVGTTWVYDVYDHGRPSGTRVKQVTGRAGVDAELDAVALATRYDDFPGVGEVANTLYLGVTETEISQHALWSRLEHQAVDPVAPAYQLPVEEGHSWSYEGSVGDATLVYETTLSEVVDVEVGGRRFTDCAHYVTESEYTFADGSGDPERIEEWTCPGVGPVKTIDVLPAQDIEITEELRAFHGPGHAWTAETPDPVRADPHAGDTLGLDAARSNHLDDGALLPELAWSDVRRTAPGFPPVGDDDVAVTAEVDGLVSARDLHTGEVRWRIALTGPVVAAPALAGGLVLVADAEKTLWALDLADGRAHWAHRFDDVVSATPLVVDDLAVVASDDATVAGIDLADGTVRWEHDLAAPAASAPALAEGRAVVADRDGGLTALDPDSGDTAWSAALDAAWAAGPAVAGGRVLAADDGGGLTALDAADGGLAWQARSRYVAGAALAVGEEAVVVNGEGSRLESFALADGERAWSVPVDDTETAPVVVGDEVVSVTTDGLVEVRSIADGGRVRSWPLPLPEPDATLEVGPAAGLLDDCLVFTAAVDAEGHGSAHYAYPLTEAARRRGVAFASEVRVLPASPSAPPALVGDTLLVPGQDQVLYRSTAPDRAEPVLRVKQSLTGVTPASTDAGDLVVVQKDREIWALPVDGDEPRWRFPTARPFPGSLPAVAGDTVFVPAFGAGLAAVDLESGQPRWFRPIDNAVSSTPPLPLPGGDVVYGAGALSRYDGATGEPVWSVPDASLFSNAAYADGVVFADIVRQRGPSGLLAVDAATGRRLWFRPNPWTRLTLGPAAADGVVVLADSLGVVRAFDARDGRVLWRLRLSTPAAGRPVVADGRVLLSETGHEEDLFQREYRVTAHDLRTGALLASFEPPGQGYVFNPAVGSTDDGTLLVPATTWQGMVVMILEPRA